MTIVIAKNQTASDLPLMSLPVPDNEIPASGQVNLTDFCSVNEIEGDAELQSYINAGNIIFNVDGVDLSQSESLSYLNSATIPADMSFISLTSTDNSSTYSDSTPLVIDWDVEQEKDSGFTHSNTTNPSRIQVDNDGTYQFGGLLTSEETGGAQRVQFAPKLLIDGVVQNIALATGYIRSSGASSDQWPAPFVFRPLKLNAGQYVEIQIEVDSSTAQPSFNPTLLGSSSYFWCLLMKGTKGDRGEPGSGSNIVVKKDGVTVGTLTDVIDIIGGVPVVDQGGNVTSIEIGNYADATGITQMPSAQINEVGITSGSIDDYNIGNFNVHFINPGNSDRPFSGMVAPAAGVNRIVTIINSGTNGKIKFENNDNASVAANRLLLADNNNFDLPRGGSVQFIYKHSSSRWITYTYY